jgi:diguanylate cyclase (GGDEF)-like protein/PAS domain S-box-containing protein
MAKILVVDDNDMNRKLAVTLLNLGGHRTVEANDGADGLAAARAERPDLIVSDILMPTMDGFEFVRRLRGDDALARTRVVFYTAHYHEREAANLAQSCRVARVLVKPCAAAEFIGAIEEVLAGADGAIAAGGENGDRGAAAPQPPAAGGAAFDRGHLALLTNKLARKAEELESANARLAALSELNVQLASEQDPRLLLEKVCRGARELVGANYAVLAAAERDGDAEAAMFTTSGVELASGTAPIPAMHSGLLGRAMSERRPWRVASRDGAPVDAGLPAAYPPAQAFVIAPLMSLTQTFGWICLGGKIGGREFSADDERVVSVLAAQAGRIYENGGLYQRVRSHAAQLQIEMERRERAAAGLRESEERFRQFAETIDDVFFVLSGDLQHTLYRSPAYEAVWGVPNSGLPDHPPPWRDSVHPQDARRLRGDDSAEKTFRIVRPDGELRWVSVRTFPIARADGSLDRVVGVASDITQRKQAEARIGQLNRVHALLSGINSLIVRVTDRDELFREGCRLAVEQGGFRAAWCAWREAATGAVRPVAWAGGQPEPAAFDPDSPVTSAMLSGQPVICNEPEADPSPGRFVRSVHERGDGSIVALPLRMDGSSVGCLVLIAAEPGFFDAAEMRLLMELSGDMSFALDHIGKAERLNYLAYYDALTGLANRTFFYERLAQHISAAARAGRSFALVVAEPERFEAINETFGRHRGDEVLSQLAQRLVACVGDAKDVARIGSTQFAALIFDVEEIGDVVRTVEDWWRRWLDAPIRIGGQDLRIQAKSGIALFPNDGADAETLMKNADSALNTARSTGDKRLFYTPHFSAQVAATLALESRLRDALERDEFVLHYQPKVDLRSRRLTGVEALIRLHTDELGLVAPMRFIPLLEESGMIVEVGAWVLRQATLDRSRWFQHGLQAPRVAVNVSTVQLRREDFVRSLSQVLRSAGSSAGLDIEVTESLIMDDADGNIAKLVAVRALGVGIAIDDFGTGYSSMGYLTRLPATALKIDRSFIVAMLDDPGAMTLVSTIISLAHTLKIDVVAEGVESEEQAKMLRLLHCDEMQGYLMSRPLPFLEMQGYLERAVH